MGLAQLLLDKPDNHLDHASRQLLTQVLADYPGILLLVSQAPDSVAGTVSWDTHLFDSGLVVYLA